MKKFVSMLLVSTLILSLFCGCGQKYTKFENEEELFDHINGLWEIKFDEYIMFNEDKVYIFSSDDIIYDIKEYFLEVAKKDYSKFQNITADAALNHINSNLDEYLYEDYTVTPEKGEISFSESKKYIIFEDTLTYIEDFEGDVENHSATQISKKTNIPKGILKDCYKTAKEDYVLPRSEFVSNIEDCAEKIKTNHKDIKSLKLSTKEESTTIYTDTGKSGEGNYNTVFMCTDSTLLYSKTTNYGKYVFTYYENEKAFVHDTIGNATLKEMCNDVLACISDYPLALTAKELSEAYESEGTYSNGGYVFNKTVNNINYQITEARGSIFIQIEF